MNLHAIVRGPITSVHPDETCVLFQSAGQRNYRGLTTPIYKPGVEVMANWQPTGEPLEHEDGMNTTPQEETVFLYSEQTYPVKGLTRFSSMRTGDILGRKDGTYYRVTNVDEDWSEDGWACVTVSQTPTAPEVIADA